MKGWGGKWRWTRNKTHVNTFFFIKEMRGDVMIIKSFNQVDIYTEFKEKKKGIYIDKHTTLGADK
jgi:hypothetical protein